MIARFAQRLDLTPTADAGAEAGGHGRQPSGRRRTVPGRHAGRWCVSSRAAASNACHSRPSRGAKRIVVRSPRPVPGSRDPGAVDLGDYDPTSQWNELEPITDEGIKLRQRHGDVPLCWSLQKLLAKLKVAVQVV